MHIGPVEFDHYPLFLAPMEDVTDPPFRHVCKMFGADMVYSEFISADGLIRDAVKSVKKLDFSEFERPVGIQIFGNAVEPMVEAARYAETARPDVIDINFGCPVKKVASKGAGSGIMNDIPKMVAITKAVVDAVNVPVTVKTRLGYDDQHREIVDIAERLQDVGIAALTIHGRLRTTKYSEPADWTLIGAVKTTRECMVTHGFSGRFALIWIRVKSCRNLMWRKECALQPFISNAVSIGKAKGLPSLKFGNIGRLISEDCPISNPSRCA